VRKQAKFVYHLFDILGGGRYETNMLCSCGNEREMNSGDLGVPSGIRIGLLERFCLAIVLSANSKSLSNFLKGKSDCDIATSGTSSLAQKHKKTKRRSTLKKEARDRKTG
jgi:hypothetical protein